MDYRKYFAKNGKVYGASYRYSHIKRKCVGYTREFTDLAEAEKWLRTEEYDFRERELGSKTHCNNILRGW